MTLKEYCCTSEIRCRRCNRLLMKGFVKTVEVKCPKCGCVQIFNCCGAHKKSD